MNAPRITVVIPTYNRACLVREAIDSALAQTLPPCEILVVDDGSTDDTPAALAHYGNRIRYVRRENGGEAAARNTGIAGAVGQWIAFLDSDDVWHPQKLERQADALTAHPGAAVLYTRDAQDGLRDRLDGPPVVIPPAPRRELHRRLLRHCCIPICTLLVRTDALADTGGFDETLRWGVDWEFLSRLCLRHDFVGVDEPLSFYRVHSGNITGNIAMRVEHGIAAVHKIYATPEARSYRRQRSAVVAEILGDGGIDLFYRGDHASARALLLRALRARPTDTRAAKYLLKTLIPAPALSRLRARRTGAA